jgi:hypothetical protein
LDPTHPVPEASVVIRQMSGTGKWAIRGIGGLGVALMVSVACAGGDTPPRDQKLIDDLLKTYPEDAVGVAGSMNMPSGGSGGGGGQGGSSVGGMGGGSSGSGNEGGSAGGGASGSSGGDACDAPGMVLIPSCGALGSSCHGAGSFVGNFGESAAAAEALVGKPANCSGKQYFNPANPQASAVLDKLADRPTCGGSPMPLGADPLSDTQVQCIEDWIGSF